MTAEYILAAVVIVMCYFVINGARQGFLRVVFSLISSIIALFLVSYLTPAVSNFIPIFMIQHSGNRDPFFNL